MKNPIVQDILKQDDHYKVLGISRTATTADIKKAYRRRAVLTHPDKLNGDRTAFDKIAKAHDVLSEDAKRQAYDRFGVDDPQQQQQQHRFSAGSAQEELIRRFFGGNHPFASSFAQQQQQQQQPRNRTVRYQLEVKLEDLYKGTTTSVLIGSPPQPQQQQHPFAPSHNNSRKQSTKKVEVHIQKGMATGQSIRLSGEMDQIKDATPADCVFILSQRPHPVFTRRGHDLAITKQITLRDALCGNFTTTVTHLDGRRISLRAPPESPMIQTGQLHVVRGEGMPKPNRVNEFGDLYVVYKVLWPKEVSAASLTQEEREQLSVLLDKIQGTNRTKGKEEEELASFPDTEVKELQTASPQEFGVTSGPYEDDVNQEEMEEEHEQQFHSQDSHFQYFSRGFPGDHNSNVQCQQM